MEGVFKGIFCGTERLKLYERPFVSNLKTISKMSILSSPGKISADTH